MAGNTGGPWGGGGNNGGGTNGGGNNGGSNGGGNKGGNRGNGGGDRPPIPEIDELVRKGQEKLRVLMGGGGRSGGTGGSGEGGGGGPQLTRGTIGVGVLVAAAAWLFASTYTVRPEQESIELFLGEFSGIATDCRAT
jgi:membrane protease subunit HflK